MRGIVPLPLKRLFAFHLGIFLPLHPSVLEPNLDLSLVETQVVGDLDAPAASEVAVKVEFFLEFQGLVARVTGSRPLAVRLCNRNRTPNPPKKPQAGMNSVPRTPAKPSPGGAPFSPPTRTTGEGERGARPGRPSAGPEPRGQGASTARPHARPPAPGRKLCTAAFTRRPARRGGGGGGGRKRETQARTERPAPSRSGHRGPPSRPSRVEWRWEPPGRRARRGRAGSVRRGGREGSARASGVSRGGIPAPETPAPLTLQIPLFF